MKVIMPFLLVLLSLASAHAQNMPDAGAVRTVGDQAAAAGPTLLEHHPRYRLHKGDTFEVQLLYSPEMNETVSLQPDGYVTLKDVGSLYVEGDTVPELVTALTGAYSKVLRDPAVTVTLRDVEKPYFLAGGQVSKPGKYELRDHLTVVEAVTVAGGFNDSAKYTQVLLFHQVPGGQYETHVLNTKRLLARQNLNEDLYVSPGDLIFVPQTAFSKVRRYIPTSALGAYYNPAF